MLITAPKTPLKFIMVAGVLWFGGLCAVAWIPYNLITRPPETLEKAVIDVLLHLTTSAAAGFLWGSLAWLISKLTN